MEPREIRELVCETLSRSPDQQMQILANQCMLHEFRRHSFAKVATDLHIDWLKIVDEFDRLKKAEGLMQMHAAWPDTARQIIEASRDKEVQCTADGCVGGLVEVKSKTPGETGKPVHALCKECHGEGTITILGNTDRLKFMLESMELIGKGAKFQVGVQVNNTPVNEKLEDLYDSVGPIIDGTPKLGTGNG